MKTRFILLWGLIFAVAIVWASNHVRWRVPFFSNTALHWSNPTAVQGAGLTADEQNNIDIYKASELATVYITSTNVRRDFFYGPVASKNLGSGFLINPDGFILTNFHVVSGSSKIQVTLSDQTQYFANALYVDRSDDLALIKIEPKKKLTFLRLGDSDHLQVGQKVLAIGDPFGLAGTLTTGVVSSIGRSFDGENNQHMEGMIQTDAAINGGNSGGPLLDSGGLVIGINTAILGQTNMGIGFALPINRAKALLSDYQSGRVRERPKVGITTEWVAGDLAEALGLPRTGGLLVQNVISGSSEEAAGVHGATQVVDIGNVELGIRGDLIVTIDGKNIDREDAWIRAVSQRHVGDNVTVSVIRNGTKINIKVKLLPPVPDLQ